MMLRSRLTWTALALLCTVTLGMGSLRAADDEALWGRVVWNDETASEGMTRMVVCRLGSEREVVEVDEKGFFRLEAFRSGSWRLSLERDRRELISFPVEAADGDHFTVKVAVNAADDSGMPQVEATVMRDNLLASAAPFITVYKNEDEAVAHMADGTLVLCNLGEEGDPEVPDLPAELFEEEDGELASRISARDTEAAFTEGPWEERDTPDRPNWRSEAIQPATLVPGIEAMMVDPDVKVSTLDADPILSGIDPSGSIGML